MQKPLLCAIIGAGSIGGLIDSPQSTNTASHAHAITKHPLCKLVAICEPNHINQTEFIKRWGEVNIYERDEELLQKEKIDLLIIASPTPFHNDILQRALQVPNISHILCEKPLVANYEELQNLEPQLLKSEKKILINLIRGYDPSFITLAKEIRENSFGKVLHFQGVFTKGLLHNGIHMLGILIDFFGKIENIQPLHVKKSNHDISGDFSLTCKSAKGLLSCIGNLPYSVFELTIWFENAKVEILEGGTKINTYVKKPSAIYEGYFSLEFEKSLPNTLNNYALNSLDFLLRAKQEKTQEILQMHLDVHKMIFETINKKK